MKKRNIVKAVLLSVAVAMIVTAVLIGAAALLMANEHIPVKGTKIAAAAAVFLPVLGMCVFIVRYADRNKMLAAMCAAAIYTILYLLIAGTAAPVQEMKLGWQIVVPFAAALVSSVWNSVKKTRRR